MSEPRCVCGHKRHNGRECRTMIANDGYTSLYCDCRSQVADPGAGEDAKDQRRLDVPLPRDQWPLDAAPNDCCTFPVKPCSRCGVTTGGAGLPFVSTFDGRFCHACYNAIRARPISDTREAQIARLSERLCDCPNDPRAWLSRDGVIAILRDFAATIEREVRATHLAQLTALRAEIQWLTNQCDDGPYEWVDRDQVLALLDALIPKETQG